MFCDSHLKIHVPWRKKQSNSLEAKGGKEAAGKIIGTLFKIMG